MKAAVLSLVALAFTLSANVVHARSVERDRLDCTIASPITLSAHKGGGGKIGIENVTKLTVQENYNANYSMIIIDGEEIGSVGYNRGKAGTIATYAHATNLALSLRPIKESGRLNSKRVAAAYAKYKGKIRVDYGIPFEVTCDFNFVTMN